MSVHYRSDTPEWSKPPDFFAKVAARFDFQLDVCATAGNAKCDLYFTKEVDGLQFDWSIKNGDVWMNPPYGRGIKNWVRKAYETSLAGTTVVCLVPARTCTAWWHDYCMKGSIEFIRGRLRFSGAPKLAPFPSALVVFQGQRS